MQFRTTIWTTIREARDRGGPALDGLVKRYWEPIRQFLRSHGFRADEAEDLAQEVLVEVCREDFLSKADKSLGRFRSLLLATTRNIAANHVRDRKALKRGGGARRVPLTEGIEGPSDPDEEYNRAWAVQIARNALDRLRALNPAYAEAIELHFFRELPHREIAERLDRKEHDVKNFLFQGKRRLKEYIQECIREYCSSAEEYEEELEDLSRYLP